MTTRKKVMVGHFGQTRVQEEDGDTVKVYSAEDWKKKQEGKSEEGNKEKKPKEEVAEEVTEKPKKKGKTK